jgi:hypothetical protein
LITNGDGKRLGSSVERQDRPVGVCVPDDVGQRFLNNSVQRLAYGLRHLSAIPGLQKLHVQPVLASLFDELGDLAET